MANRVSFLIGTNIRTTPFSQDCSTEKQCYLCTKKGIRPRNKPHIKCSLTAVCRLAHTALINPYVISVRPTCVFCSHNSAFWLVIKSLIMPPLNIPCWYARYFIILVKNSVIYTATDNIQKTPVYNSEMSFLCQSFWVASVWLKYIENSPYIYKLAWFYFTLFSPAAPRCLSVFFNDWLPVS